MSATMMLMDGESITGYLLCYKHAHDVEALISAEESYSSDRGAMRWVEWGRAPEWRRRCIECAAIAEEGRLRER